MGMRIPLAADLVPGAQSASVRFRAGKPMYRVQAHGGFAGTVTIQNSVDSLSIPDASCQWAPIGEVANDDTIEITGPVSRVRVNGTHTGANADVTLIEDPTL